MGISPQRWLCVSPEKCQGSPEVPGFTFPHALAIVQPSRGLRLKFMPWRELQGC